MASTPVQAAALAESNMSITQLDSGRRHFPNEVPDLIAHHSVESYSVTLTTQSNKLAVSGLPQILNVMLVSHRFNEVAQQRVRDCFSGAFEIPSYVICIRIRDWAAENDMAWLVDATVTLVVRSTLTVSHDSDRSERLSLPDLFYMDSCYSDPPVISYELRWRCFGNLKTFRPLMRADDCSATLQHDTSDANLEGLIERLKGTIWEEWYSNGEKYSQVTDALRSGTKFEPALVLRKNGHDIEYPIEITMDT